METGGFLLCARRPVEFPRLRGAYLFESFGMTGEASPDGLFLSLCQSLSVDERGWNLRPAFLVLPRDHLRSLLRQKALARRPLRFHLEFVDEVSVNPVVLTQSFRVICDV